MNFLTRLFRKTSTPLEYRPDLPIDDVWPPQDLSIPPPLLQEVTQKAPTGHRFWSLYHIREENECWPLKQAPENPRDAYVTTGWQVRGQKTLNACAYTAARRRVPLGRVLHTCGRTAHECGNPAHLYDSAREDVA